ncbi:MAG: tRNA 2-thiouridine(34) synthase MnmA [Armatimonadetes bacterium]|nr:tRNA 2-thiouridine(34) synthase MnmA [Armatimonadota bacterium]
MSGGVDSSVAAALLLEQGFEVIGVTMRLWGGADTDPFGDQRFGGCCSINETEDARRVAEALGVPHYVFNLEKAFTSSVVNNFVEEYLAGRTPNPCVRCNRFIKFDVLLRRARELEADFIATGHYARVEKEETTGRYRLLKGVDPRKDQSYVLYNLNQEHLRWTMLPLGGLSKDLTRQVAVRFGFENSSKPDSQEICFVEDKDYGRFIAERRPEAVRGGEILDDSGNVLGTHRGTAFYTIGQRKGLGIAAPHPLYVTGIDPQRNAVTVGEVDALLAEGAKADDVNWVSGVPLSPGTKVMVRIRYNAEPVVATVDESSEDAIVVSFEEAQKAVTPGQSLVLYVGEEVVGGGTIVRSVRTSPALSDLRS